MRQASERLGVWLFSTPLEDVSPPQYHRMFAELLLARADALIVTFAGGVWGRHYSSQAIPDRWRPQANLHDADTAGIPEGIDRRGLDELIDGLCLGTTRSTSNRLRLGPQQQRERTLLTPLSFSSDG